MNIQRILLLAIISPTLIALAGCSGDTSGKHAEHDDHASEHTDRQEDDHGHDEHNDHDAHNEKGGGDHDDHDEHGGEIVRLTDAQLEAAGVKIQPLTGGVIASNIMLPAEVGLNLDAVVHVTPRVTGIVSSVDRFLGDKVVAGDLLAVLESPELGETKIAYLQTIQAKLIADAELDRQQTISENTAKLLEILRTKPSPMDIHQQTGSLRIGANKGRLLSAYARMKAGEANYAREQGLNEKGLSTQADLLASQEMYYSAQADYMAAFEEIDFSYRLRLQEASQAAMIAASGVENSRRRLHLLGLSEVQIQQIATEADSDVARYELHTPLSGRIVSKHLTPGERVGTDSSVYTIADLSTVWLNISVYSQYSGMIAQGQHVTVHAGDQAASGVVDYISAVVAESTRTVAARVVIDNSDGSWKPGSFVTVYVATDQTHADRIVPLDAIQTYEGHTVVFIQGDEGIEPDQVTIGRKSETHVELLGDDIAIGSAIVVANSFLMKAELGKSSAGHQH